MQKEVIYIDIDDDITAIIGKIKKSKEKLVAVVPPKRSGALQSAVNLRLLDRMAKAEKKRLVLVTNNKALVALAASAKIPVAKNLQSKPEVPEIPALVVDNDDDIIDGSELPVGDHAKTTGAATSGKQSRNDAIDDVDLDVDEDVSVGLNNLEKPSEVAVSSRPSSSKKESKIPDFDGFRKKLFIGIGGGAVLVALLIWMFVFAPAATVIITARTSPSPVSATVKLGGTAATDYSKGVVSSLSQKQQENIEIEFEATGQKDVGEKATGKMTVTRTSVSTRPISIPAGTQFSAGGLTFLSVSAATLEPTSLGENGIIQPTATFDVVAASAGEKFNVSARSYQASVSGFTSYGGAMSGGTTKIAKVVSADDIERAKGQLIGKATDDYKRALIAKFKNGEKVIDSSFNVERGEVVSVPAVDVESPDGKAKLTAPTTFTIQAVSKADLEAFLRQYIESKVTSKDTQRLFDTGVDGATISNFQSEDGQGTATVNATGRVGPKIDETEVKELAKGKIYGEVQESLQSRDGIKDVDVKFSYFWVRTVPGDINKITVQYKVENE